MDVEATLPISEALLLVSRKLEDFVGFERDGTRFVVHRDDLGKMAAMGLDTLPVESIAVPGASTLLAEAHGETGQRGEPKAQADYSRRLSRHFPVYFVAALYELQSLLTRFGIKGYVVGGITRDLILYQQKRLEVRDVDITVEGDALALADFLMENSRNFTVVERFPEFGTAKIRYKESLSFDLASTRQEIYPHCGALPVVVKRGVPLMDDIIRRDFTINALAFSVHELGQVLDYSDGIRDIGRKAIRVLHPLSFFEDPSRILRALKFCARLNFELGGETRHLIDRFLAHGGASYKGGGDRIKQELKGFFSVEETPAKSRWVEFFITSGCYRLLNMEAGYEPSPEIRERLSSLGGLLPLFKYTLSAYLDVDFSFDVYLCFLCAEMPAEAFQRLSQRLGLTRNEREFTEQFRKVRPAVPQRFGGLHEFSSPVEIYDLFRGLHLVSAAACMLELGFQDRSGMKTVLEAFLMYKRKWERMALELDGNDLIELGVKEGKSVGVMLDQLLHAKLAGQVKERLDEIQYVRQQLQPEPAESENAGIALEKPRTGQEEPHAGQA